MNLLSAVVKLTRIEHSLLLIIAVVAAELISGGIPQLPIFALSLVTPFFVSMGAFAINDYFDVETDRANRRTDRPIVSGAISRSGAYYVAIVSFAIGIIASAFINMYAFVIALLFAVLAYLYAERMKDMLLVGNVYVAFSMVIPFIFGNIVVSDTISISIVLISFIVFSSGLAREIHGMIRDRSGDIKVRGARNLIRYIGVKKSATIALILYVEAIGIGIFLFFYDYPFKYNFLYLILVTIANLMFAYVAFGYMNKDNRRFFDLSRNLSLAGMGIALVAFLLAPILYIGAYV
ncbi:MAG: UbiA family prenyltransferase [Candidatus Micrarchaeales archaeon]|nr:UbiA family prenyltransferase [Candidatus Micrarchaeales archaeon]